MQVAENAIADQYAAQMISSHLHRNLLTNTNDPAESSGNIGNSTIGGMNNQLSQSYRNVGVAAGASNIYEKMRNSY